ncbi:hypothetical protein KCP69_16345 [Salmonella enterica subsp. enterica]|nr:hypothetical protein KCP69_16345 [Salmonella enterica subsp. enterica]
MDLQRCLPNRCHFTCTARSRRKTHHLLNHAAFDQMKNGVMVINTSRGALIDSRAAIEAL